MTINLKSLPPLDDFNRAADFWRYVIGVNVIPAKSKKKVTSITWKQSGYQHNSISEEQHNEWKRTNAFAEGMAVITGKVWRGEHAGEYFNCIDCDNKLAIQEFCTKDGQTVPLEKIAEEFIVEQHKDNPNKAHIYFYSNIPVIAKSSSTPTVGKDIIENNVVPGFEIKSQNNTIVFCSPSYHQNGEQIKFIGNCTIPITLNERESEELMQHLENIHKKYGMQYLDLANGGDSGKSLIPMAQLEKDDFVIYEGNNRPEALMRYMESRIKIFRDRVPLEEIRELCYIWNQQHCKPPLDDKMFERQWKDAQNFIKRKDREREEREEEEQQRRQRYEQQQQQRHWYHQQQPSIPPAYKNDYFEYLISCAQRTVKEENSLIRQINLTILSAYSDDPNNLGEMAPASSGKTYPIMECVKFTPGGREIRIVGSMTPKVLVREQGVLVDKLGNPIGKDVRRLKSSIAEAKYKKQFAEVAKYQEELAALLDGSAYILEMSGTVLIFLEPPHPELWGLMKPILSHDFYEIEYPFVDNVGHGLEVKRVITRGWPACIFCSAKDESKWDIWPEIESRFMISSPNMVKPKYEKGNKLIATKKWQPKGVKQKLIISDSEKQLGKDCFLYLKHQLLSYKSKTDSPVWAPFGDYIGEIFPSDKGQDNRAFNRFATMLNMITLCKAHLRCKVLYDDEELVIPSLNDLQQTLHVMQNISGLPPHKLKFYKKYVLAQWEERASTIPLKTKDIADYYNAQNKDGKGKMTSDNLRKNYLTDLAVHNYLEEEQDPDTKQTRYIYTPLVDIDEEEEVYKAPIASILEGIDENLQFSKLLIPKNHPGIPEDWLNQQILQLSERRFTNAPLKIISPEGQEIAIDGFIAEYEREKKLNFFFNGPR